MGRPRSKLWIVAGASAALVTALVIALRPKPVGVDIVSLARGPMAVQVEEEGRTRVKQVYTVSAPIAGRILRTELETGDAVVKDRTIVAIIQPTDPPFLDNRSRHEIEAQIAATSAAIDLAGAELRQAESELEFADADYKRSERLARSGTVAERVLQKARLDMETRRAAVARMKAQVELRRRELEGAQARLIGPEAPPNYIDSGPTLACCVTVRAPMSGRILKRIHESEKVVPSGTPLVDIGDVNEMEIIVDLLSADAVKIQPGSTATITGWGGPSALAASVRRIEPGGFTKISALGIEEQRVRTVLDFEPNSDTAKLGHDYRVFVAITTWRADDVLRVPLSALFRKGAEWSVFAVRAGRATRIAVIIGQRNSEVAEVVKGLVASDTVIVHPSDRVTDGVRVAQR